MEWCLPTPRRRLQHNPRRTMNKSPTLPASTPTAWMAEGKERMPVPTIALKVVEKELSRVQHRDPEGLEATPTPPMEITMANANPIPKLTTLLNTQKVRLAATSFSLCPRGGSTCDPTTLRSHRKHNVNVTAACRCPCTDKIARASDRTPESWRFPRPLFSTRVPTIFMIGVYSN